MSKKNQKQQNEKQPSIDTEETVQDESVGLDESEVSEVEAEVFVDEPEETPEEALMRERDEYQEKWLRVVAELDNVRKRSARQLVEARRFAQADVLRSFLEVQDNFERALQSMNDAEDTEGNKRVKDGVDLIFQNYRRVLKDQGVQAIEALDQEFDPAVHESVGQFEREGVDPGMVIEIVQQGFKMGDLVLRPSRVIISS